MSVREWNGGLLKNWIIVWLGNLAGSLVAVALIYLAATPALGGGGVGEAMVSVAAGKVALPPATIFFKAIMCNVFVCLAVWVAYSSRTVVDKVAGVLLPISAFVAAGFAEAARITCEQREASFAHVSSLKREILDGLAEHFEGLRVNARDDGSPYIVSFSIPGTSNTQVIRALDERGICISASTACATSRADVPAGTWRAKHPLTSRLAGFPASWLRCTYRVSLCKDTTAEDVRAFLEAFTAAADKSLAGR